MSAAGILNEIGNALRNGMCHRPELGSHHDGCLFGALQRLELRKHYRPESALARGHARGAS